LDQADVEFVRPGQVVQIQLDQEAGRLLSGTVREVSEIDLKVTPTELLPGGTIPTRPDESGVPRPVETVYQARVALQPNDVPLPMGQSGEGKIYPSPMSLARRLSRYLSRTFRFELQRRGPGISGVGNGGAARVNVPPCRAACNGCCDPCRGRRNCAHFFRG